MTASPPTPPSIEIDGHTYTIALLPAWPNLELLPLVGRIVAPTLTSLARVVSAAADENASDLDAKIAGELAGLGEAVTKTFETISPAELRQLTAKLLTGCLVTLKETGQSTPLMPIFDTHFMARPFAICRLVGFATSQNYRDFTSGLRMLGSRLGNVTSSKPPAVVESSPVIASKVTG